MKMITPVFPSQDIQRYVEWYKNMLGFEAIYADKMYAVLRREGFSIHLQWHADNEDDPLLGGSVIRITVEDIDLYFKEMVSREAVAPDSLRRNTPWETHEFGIYDINKNAIFFSQSL